MRSIVKSLSPRISLGIAVLTCVLITHGRARAEDVIFYLNNGDRLAGKIISEGTNHVVIATSWIKELSIPISEIKRREQFPAPPAVSSAGMAQPVAKKIPPAAAAPAAPPAKPKHWKAETRVGANFLYGAKNQQIYYGRLKLTYARPYESNPRQFFRNTFDYSADYGWTQTPTGSGAENSVLSANQMFASDKTGFDIGERNWFVYDLARVGYDEIRKIDFQAEIGPGLGYHLITQPDLVMNVESGIEYQERYRSDQTATKNFYFRLAQDTTWKINRDVTLTGKFEFLPQANSADFRARVESTLSYALWRNLSLHLSLLDLYDTEPAQRVTNNDLQVQTSLGVAF